MADGFDRVVLVEGDELVALLGYLRDVTEADLTPVALRFAIDGDALKIKANQRTWTPGYGTLDPACVAARPEPAEEGPTDWVQRLRDDSPEIRSLFPTDPPA